MDTGASYQGWNDRLLDYFFNESLRYRTVRINIDEDVLTRLSGNADDLVLEVLLEAETRGCDDIQALGLLLHDEWLAALEHSDPGASPPRPPFFAVLVLYVLAVNHGGGDHPAHQYYDRLHRLLCSPGRRIRDLPTSWCMWESLDRWSSRLWAGRIGIFEVGIVGQQKWVGIARRQVLLAPREEEPLQRAFLAAGLTPGTDPTDRRVRIAVRAAPGLLSRTKKLISRWPKDEIARELLEEVRARFDAWDHVAPSPGLETGAPLILPLRLVLERASDDISGGYFESESLPDANEEGSRLTPVEDRSAEHLLGVDFWLVPGDISSRATVVDRSGNPGWADPEMWFRALRFRVDNKSLLLNRPNCSYLVFKPSSRRGLLEEVDTKDLNPGEIYLLLARTPIERIPHFVEEFRRDWRRCDLSAGLTYRPFKAAAEIDDQPRARFRLVGGIRTEPNRRCYLGFALPELVLEIPREISDFQIALSLFDSQGSPLREVALREMRRRVPADTDPLLPTTESLVDVHTSSLPSLPADCAACELQLTIEGERAASARFFVEQSPGSTNFEPPEPEDTFGLPPAEEGVPIITGLTPPTTAIDCVPDLPVGRLPEAFPESSLEDIAAQRMMQLMRSRGAISWARAKLWLPGCLSQSRDGTANYRYLIDQVQALHSLGVIDLQLHRGGGFRRLVALRPVMLLLSRRANLGVDTLRSGVLRMGHEAILAGCWLPNELARFAKAARKARLKTTTASRGEGLELAPHRRSVIAEGEGKVPLRRLSELAREIGIEFDDGAPTACRFALSLSDIRELPERTDWQIGHPSEINRQHYFDPLRIAVSPRLPDYSGRYEVWECCDPRKPVWSHFLVDNEQNRYLRVADRQLARWFLRLHVMPDVPVPVDQRGALILPVELRLPRILERTFALGSGQAPRLRRYRASTSPFRRAEYRRRFGIPAPPDRPVHWMAHSESCSGNFVCYDGAYGTSAWLDGDPMPMLSVHAERVSTLFLNGETT